MAAQTTEFIYREQNQKQ